MNKKTLNLPLTLVNAVLQYLDTKPYGEVNQLVQTIHQVAQPQLAQAQQEANSEQTNANVN